MLPKRLNATSVPKTAALWNPQVVPLPAALSLVVPPAPR